MGLHTDWSGVDNRVKAFAAEDTSRDDVASDSFGQFSRSFFAASADPDASTRLRESERRSPRNTARAEDQHAAVGKRKFPPEGAQNPDVVRVAAEERTISPNDHRVYSANLGRKRVTFF